MNVRRTEAFLRHLFELVDFVLVRLLLLFLLVMGLITIIRAALRAG